MTTTTTRKTIGLWLDTTGTEPRWIVSRDTLDARGNAETSRTVEVFDEDEYEAAKALAAKLAAKDGLEVVEA